MSEKNPSISLREFISQTKEELEVFEKNWSALADIDSQNWPMSMPIGDWEDQFEFMNSRCRISNY